jgi:phosphotransferase system IIA component
VIKGGKMVSDSIIDIIQKMVQEGQPREKIIETLHSLGVDDEQAKKLLLIAEADTFTLLKKEINSLVKNEFDFQKKDFEDIIHSDLKKIEDSSKKEVKKLAFEELSGAKEEIFSQTKSFEEQINKTISSSQKTVGMVKMALDSINTKISQMELDVEQLKVHKFRKKSMFFSYAMLVLGAFLLAFTIILFAVNFNEIDSAQMIMVGVLILASITLMFASIIG